MNILTQNQEPTELVKLLVQTVEGSQSTHLAEKLRDYRDEGRISTGDYYLAVYQLVMYLDGCTIVGDGPGRFYKELAHHSPELFDALSRRELRTAEMMANSYEKLFGKRCEEFDCIFEDFGVERISPFIQRNVKVAC